MVDDKVIGYIMATVGGLGILLELWVLILDPLADASVLSGLPKAQYWAMALPLFLGIVGVLGIVTWIGITMIKTPPPEMMEFEDFDETELAENKSKDAKKEKSKKKAEPKKKKKAAPKKETKTEKKAEKAESSGRSIEDVDGVTASVVDGLREAGYDTVEKLSKATLDDLTAIKGIGKKTAERILEDSQ